MDLAISEKQTLINLVMRGMELNLPDQEKAAIKVGVPVETYRLTRKLILLLKMQILSPDEENTIKDGLKVLELTGRVTRARELTQAILDKHWAGQSRNGKYSETRNTHPGRARIKQRTRFESTIFAIREACTNNDELIVPEQLTPTERNEALDTVMLSMRCLIDLVRKIKGGTREQD